MIVAYQDAITMPEDPRARLLGIDPRQGPLDPLALAAQADLREEYLGRSLPADPLPDKALLERRLEEADARVREIEERLASADAAPQQVKAPPPALSREKLTAELKAAVTERAAAEAALAAALAETNFTKLQARVQQTGIFPQILRLRSALNAANLPPVTRLLLATEGVLDYLLLKLLVADKANPADVEGMKHAVLVNVAYEPRSFFFERLVDRFAADSRLVLSQDARRRLAVGAASSGMALGPAGRIRSALRGLHDTMLKEGELPWYVRRYAERGEISKLRFTPDVMRRMVAVLEDFGLELDASQFDAGAFDEYFALAYREAVQSARRGEDPLDLKHARSDLAPWDFQVDTFDMAEDQGVVKDNILAASVLYYVYVLGDLLGAFQFADALLLRRAKGRLDLGRTAAAKLHGYKLRRADRLTVEERRHFYRRAFDIGGGKVLEGTVVNEAFPRLWHALMKEVAENIRKNEENGAAQEKASRAPVEDAIRLLQYNLSAYLGDMELDVQELYRQFEEVKELLSDPEVIAAVGGGRRQNMWTLMERLAAEEFDGGVNVAALRTLAVEGWRILQFVARFAGPAPDADFDRFRKSCEAWIIAQATVGDMDGRGPGAEDDDEDGAEDDEEW